jgi:large repetitive protein
MTSFLRKVMTGLALLVVGGLVIGGTMALASNRSTGAAVSSSASQTAGVDDDGTADQGPGDVPVNADDQVADDDDGTPDQGPGDFPFDGDDQVADDDDGTPDQGPGDFPFDDDEVGDDHGGHGGDDHSGPSENSGPGSDDSGHGSDDSGHGSDD